MTRYRSHILLALALGMAGATASGQTRLASDRGQLLYNTHCVACHDKQLHWRQNKKASSWVSLLTQVQYWQAAEKLAWNDADIKQVARYLNDTIYHYPMAKLAQEK